ncbi:hypothetical protein DPSP01_005954 [Paraphaeosphaeria sporulosa]
MSSNGYFLVVSDSILAAGLYDFYLTAKAGTISDSVDEAQYQSINFNMYGPERAAAEAVRSGVDGEDARVDYEMNVAQQNVENNYHPLSLRISINKKNSILGRGISRVFFKQPARAVTAFGWLGWTSSAVYIPMTNVVVDMGGLLCTSLCNSTALS